jgi:hypothetical protein
MPSCCKSAAPKNIAYCACIVLYVFVLTIRLSPSQHTCQSCRIYRWTDCLRVASIERLRTVCNNCNVYSHHFQARQYMKY